MRRDLRVLSDETFDLVVVGAGVCGLAAAWDATQRGLRVALVDRGDFGAATSANSLKIVHGGLRYLQSAAFGRVRTSVKERRALLRVAPHLVTPLPCLLPTRRRLTRSRLAMGTALRLHETIGWDRNRGLAHANRIPRGRLLTRDEVAAAVPGLALDGITGGALWYDAIFTHAERLALAFLHSAVGAGAAAANHCEAIEALRADGRVGGVRVKDRLGGDEFDLRARAVLDTTGPFSGRLLGRPPAPLVAAYNVVVRPLDLAYATGIGQGGDRLFFFVPWRGRTMVGTTYRPWDGDPTAFAVTDELVASFVADLNSVYPAAALTPKDVSFVHAGLQPRDPDGAPSRTPRVADHAADGSPGLLSAVTVKYTTARAVAQDAVDLVFRTLGRTPPPCRTAVTPLHGACTDVPALAGDIEARYAIGAAPALHLAESYGLAYASVLRHAADAPGAVDGAGSVQRAEILHAVRDEMARTLADVVFGRTSLATAGDPGEEALLDCARLIADELEWTAERKAAEIDAVKRRLQPRQGEIVR